MRDAGGMCVRASLMGRGSGLWGLGLEGRTGLSREVGPREEPQGAQAEGGPLQCDVSGRLLAAGARVRGSTRKTPSHSPLRSPFCFRPSGLEAFIALGEATGPAHPARVCECVCMNAYECMCMYVHECACVCGHSHAVMLNGSVG